MDPIDLRVDTTFAQALQCVQYRLAIAGEFRVSGHYLAVGARYGMVGVAAVHHLLLTAAEDEECSIISMAESWQDMVEDHAQWEACSRMPFPISREASRLAGRVAAMSLQTYYPLYRKLYPLTHALETVGESLVADNEAMIVEGWPWFRRRHAMRLFRSSIEESMDFALHFFERRQAWLDEVPEIALIGE